MRAQRKKKFKGGTEGMEGGEITSEGGKWLSMPCGPPPFPPKWKPCNYDQFHDFMKTEFICNSFNSHLHSQY